MLVGSGANNLATEMGMPTVSQDDLITAEAREEFNAFVKFQKTVDVSFRQRYVYNKKNLLE